MTRSFRSLAPTGAPPGAAFYPFSSLTRDEAAHRVGNLTPDAFERPSIPLQRGVPVRTRLRLEALLRDYATQGRYAPACKRRANRRSAFDPDICFDGSGHEPRGTPVVTGPSGQT
jgi:hypothetical protein